MGKSLVSCFLRHSVLLTDIELILSPKTYAVSGKNSTPKVNAMTGKF